MDELDVRWLLFPIALVAGAVALVWLLAPRPGAVARGRGVYERAGCAGCHGPGGTGGVPNPGSVEREVPALTGGSWMMYVEAPEDVREWILDGRPARLDAPAAGPDALLGMPAYRTVLTTAELDDLVAWYGAVSGYAPGIPAEAAEGRRTARRLGCFGCHGGGGREGVRNPGSFKGYVPGWGSPDFADLVRDEQELEAWILDGGPARITENPIARHFLDAQVVTMPAYRDLISDAELQSLLSYIQWLGEDPR